MTRTSAILCLALVLGFAPATQARAQDTPADPLFAVRAADGTTATGPLRKIADDWSVRLGGEAPALVAGTEVIAMRRQGALLPPAPIAYQVVLSNGDRLPLLAGAPLRLAGERLECSPQPPLRLTVDRELRLPIATVALLWIAPPDGTEDPDRLLRRLLAGRRSKDVVILRNGDQVEGTVTALDREAFCRLDTGQKPLAVPFARVAAVAFSTELLARPRPKGVYGHLIMAGGGRLALASARIDVDRRVLAGKTLLGTAVAIPLDQVAALELRQGRAVYLSDLAPRAYEHTPFLGVAWPLVKDGSVAGGGLRLAGNTYDKGLGMHSQSRLIYNLAGNYDWFEALVGLDDTGGKGGSARIQVLVDGKAQDLGWDKELRARDQPLALRIDVRKARELVLVVGFGPRGDIRGHVDWAEARLIKASP